MNGRVRHVLVWTEHFVDVALVTAAGLKACRVNSWYFSLLMCNGCMNEHGLCVQVGQSDL